MSTLLGIFPLVTLLLGLLPPVNPKEFFRSWFATGKPVLMLKD
jgi:hypothetical protein